MKKFLKFLGAQVNVIDMNDSKWYHIEYQGNTGYCSSSYLYDIGGSSGELPEGFEDAMFLKHDDYYAVGAVRYTYIANDVMNLRSAPSGGSVVAALANDTAVTILEQTDYSDSYVKVRVNSTNQVGYIFKPSLYVRPLAGHSSDSGKIMSDHVLQDGYKEVLKEMADALGTHYLVLAGILQCECSGMPTYTDNWMPLIRIEGKNLLYNLGPEYWQTIRNNGYVLYANYKAGTTEITSYAQLKDIVENNNPPGSWSFRKNGTSINSPTFGSIGVRKYGYLYELADLAGEKKEVVFDATSYGCMQLMGNSASGYKLAMSGESVLDRMSTGNVEQMEFLFRFLDHKLNNSSNTERSQALKTLKNDPFNNSALKVVGRAYNGDSSYADGLIAAMQIIERNNGMS